jgi:hypothetical protein
MQGFSLDNLAEKVHFNKSRKYFEEVLSSYNNANYRSAVVMLWSVAVCDMVYKLQSLIDTYEDKKAKEILTKVKKMQADEPKSPLWELILLDEVHESTMLLDAAEYENLRSLQKQRHLSAHPILNAESELHSPNKDTVRALLRNTLEGLLVKPPFYTQKIVDEFLQDIGEASDALSTRDKVRSYITSRYLNRIKPKVELSLFKSLWKLVFKLKTGECEKNRRVNYEALFVLFERNRADVLLAIQDEPDYYNSIPTEGEPIDFLVMFLSTNDQLYHALSNDAKLKIKHCISNTDIGKTVGWYVKDGLDKHLEDLCNWIVSDEKPEFKNSHFEVLLTLSDTKEWEQKVCQIASIFYSSSQSFDQADKRFQVAIVPNLPMFTKASLEFLVCKIETNSQCYWRGRAEQNYKILLEHAEKVELKLEDLDAPNFHRVVGINVVP